MSTSIKSVSVFHIISVFVIVASVALFTVSIARADDVVVSDAPVITDAPVVTDAPADISITDTSTTDTSPVVSDVEPTPTDSSSSEDTTPPATETTSLAAAAASLPTPVLTTDKDDYHPGETATIFGKFFGALQNVALYIVGTMEDGSTATSYNWNVSADENGSFTTTYQLPNFYVPLYLLAANTQTGELLTQTTFTDAVATDINQCQNGGVGSPLQPCSETAPFAAANGYGYEGNAAANSSNSHWTEGDFVPLRIIGTGYAAGAGYIEFSIDVTKGGKHAYDYIGSFDQTETLGLTSASHFNHNNPVTDIIAGANPSPADSSGTIPGATLAPFPVACGSNTFIGSQTAGAIKAWGTSGPLTVTYTSENVGSSDCSTVVRVAWTGTAASFNGTIVLAYSAHIATQADWGTGNSAINISGSPYHSSLVARNTGGDTKGIGNQDAKLSASAIVVPNSITIHKVMVGGTATFTFTGTPNGTISANNGTLSAAPPNGAGSVTESTLSGWSLTNLTCLAPTGGATVTPNQGTRTVSYTMPAAGGGGVDCTFTNTLQQGHIIVDKVTVPALDSQSFAFTTTGTGYNGFNLTDAAAPNDQTVNAGTYSVSETAVSGWTQTSATCDGGNTPASISLTAGATVHCTFTNTKKGHLNVQKTTIPGADLTSFSITASGSGTITAPAASSVTDAADHNYEVTPGTYSVTETVPSGWTKTGDSCQNVVVAAGATVNCLLTNTKDAKLTVHKVVINHGGNATTASFAPYKVDSTSVTLDIANVFATGAHVVTEAPDANYTATFSGACDAGGNVTLSAGDDKTCTITNEEKPATIVVHKIVVNHGLTNNSAHFAPYKVGLTTVTLDAVTGINSGTYSVTEATDANYAATYSGDCDANGSVTVTSGSAKSCTITNTEIATHLTVHKVVINHGGNATEASFAPYKIDGGAVTLDVSNLVNSGAHSVTEVIDPNYTQTFSDACDASGNVTLVSGDNKTCTITNEEKPAKLIVTKVVVNHGQNKQVSDFPLSVDATGVTSGVTNTFNSGSHTVSETSNADYTAVISGDCNPTTGVVTLVAGQTKSCTITNTEKPTHLTVKKVVINHGLSFDKTHFAPYSIDSTTVTEGSSNLVDSGNHTVGETTDANYTQTFSANCAGGSITLATGDDATCTITNEEKLSDITVKKVVTNHGGNATPASFAPYKVDTTVVTLDSATTFDSGNHTVTEVSDPAYTATFSGDCNVSGVVALGSNEHKTCTITNEEIPTHLKVTKIVVNHGGSAVVSNFPLFVDAGGVTSGVNNLVNSGAHTVSETSNANYTSVISGDCAVDGSITLASGANAECTITNTEIPTHLTVKKEVINHGGNATVAIFAPYSIDAVTVTEGVSNVVDSGTHSVGETTNANYTQTFSANCSNGSITLATGDDATCTITNEEKPAKIIVTKVVVTDNGGTKVVSDFPLFVGQSGAVSGVTNTFDSGTYVVSETGSTGYSATISGDCNPDTGSVTLVPGQTKNCTITNDDVAPSLTLNKITSYTHGGTAPESTWTLTADGGVAGLLSGAGAVGDTDVVSAAGFKAGTYALSESAAPAGYTNGAAYSCVKNGNPAVSGNSITLALGDVATCTITNTDLPGKLIVVKNTVGGDDKFSFSGTGFTGDITTDNGTNSTGEMTINAGSYNVSELPIAHWDLTSSSCSNGTPANFSIANGQTVTCTFTNTAKGHLIVQKTTLPAGDTTSFSITASGNGSITAPAASTVTDAADHDYEVTPGTYSVSETVPNGWAKTGDTCQNVVVGAGETKTCLLTNTKEAKITLEKVCEPDDAENTFAFTLQQGAGAVNALSPVACGDKNIEIVAPTTDSTKFVDWKITETATPGWNITNISCTGDSELTKTTNSATISLDPGENVKCVFTNQAPPPGRITGGGSIFSRQSDTGIGGLTNNTRITHGFQLHCNALVVPNRLEINWAGNGKKNAAENNFHLTSLTNVQCIDDSNIDAGAPVSPIDTIEGYGVGKFNGVDGYKIHFVFTDAGEPGKGDASWYVITAPDSSTVLRIGGTWDALSNVTTHLIPATALEALVTGTNDPYHITSGNQQAHK